MATLYVDKEFPPEFRSLGVALPRSCVWKRAPEVVAEPGVQVDVFTDCIEPSDVQQGTLGDCWLMSAIAAVAEFEDVVRETFVTEELNPEGKYTVKLFEPYTLPPGAKPPPVKTGDAKKEIEGKWRYITVDDFIPCLKNGGAACARGVDGEIWVCLLEKAFAKYCGSYSALSGGYPTLALMALTGKPSYQYMFGRQLGAPAAYELDFCSAHCRQVAQQPGMARVRKTGVKYNKEEFWAYLLECDQKDYVMVLATGGKDEMTETGADRGGGGVVDGHAYSLNTVVECGHFRLCQVRNPWGDFEWKGDFSDGSRMWLKHPEVATACKYDPHSADANDGTFWMLYEDLMSTFESVTVNFLVRADKKRAPYMQKSQRARAKLRGAMGLAANAATASEKRESSQSMPPPTDSQQPTKVVLPPHKGDVPMPFHAVANVPRPTPLPPSPTQELQVPQPWEKRRPTNPPTQKPSTHTSVVNTSMHTSSTHTTHVQHYTDSATTAAGELRRQLVREESCETQAWEDPYAALANRREALRRMMQPDELSLTDGDARHKASAAALEALDGLSLSQLNERFARTMVSVNLTLQQLAGTVDKRVVAEGMLTPLSKALVEQWDALGSLEGDSSLLPMQNLLAAEEAELDKVNEQCADLQRQLTDAGVSLKEDAWKGPPQTSEYSMLRSELERIPMPQVDVMDERQAREALVTANATIAELTDALYTAHDERSQLRSALSATRALQSQAPRPILPAASRAGGAPMFHVQRSNVYDNLGFFY